MKISKKVAFVALLVILSCGKKNDSIEASKLNQIDDLLSALHQTNQFNGVFLIGDRDKVLFQNAYGVYSNTSETLLNRNSIFEIASVSKTLTATLVMKMIEEGYFTEESLLSEFYPQLPYKNITIGHLLTHTSGIPDYYETIVDPFWDTKNELSNDTLFFLYQKHKPEMRFKPGEKFEYSNTGYLFLAGIVEKASNENYDDLLLRYVLEPAGMTSAKRKIFIDNHPLYAHGNVLSVEQSEYVILTEHEDYHGMLHYYFSDSKGPGSISSSAGDLWRFSVALQSGSILNEEQLQKMWSHGILNSGEKTNYGRGWQITHSGEDEWRHHRGGTEGYNSFFRISLNMGYTYALLTNVQQPYLSRINAAIGQILNGNEIDNILISGAEQVALKLNSTPYERLKKEILEMREKPDQYYFSLAEFNEVAWKYWLKEDYDNAFAFLHIATVAMPDNAGAFEVLAEGYMETNQYEKAIEFYQITIDMLLSDAEKRDKKWVKEWVLEMKTKIEEMQKKGNV